jgi:BirA family biotin operon repressor/biotin-[acetyl-CoA-carboxylase] ligase
MASIRPDDVLPRLRGRFGRPYRYLETCASTQREFAPDDAEGTVVATDHQTAGRGRLGRIWEDAPGTSLLFSVLLLPPVSAERLPELSVLAATAVAGAVEDVAGLPTEVKDPNDVLVAGRKMAGVLGETSEGRVVLGIGINVAQRADELPPETRLPATSLALEGAEVDRAELLAAVLERLERGYNEWVKASAPAG